MGCAAAGVVHRDLKPANVIFYFARNEWALIDMGGAAMIGSEAPITCTLAYAAPETIHALAHGERTVIADAAVDVWALGVMAFELFTRTRAFEYGSREVIEAAMREPDTLPWERTSDPEFERNMRRMGWMKDDILRMLTRDPRERLPVQDAVRRWRSFLRQETTHR